MAALFVPAANTRQGSKSLGPRLIHLSRRPLHRAAGDAFSPVFVTGRHNAVAYDLGLGIEPVDVEAEASFLLSERLSAAKRIAITTPFGEASDLLPLE